MKKMTIYLPDDLATAVSEEAKRKGSSEASLIREALAQYVATIKRPRPSIIGSVSIDGVAGEDTEDYLLEHWKPWEDER